MKWQSFQQRQDAMIRSVETRSKVDSLPTPESDIRPGWPPDGCKEEICLGDGCIAEFRVAASPTQV